MVKTFLSSYLDDSSSVNLEFVLEGNPKAPRILLEHQMSAPMEAYVKKVVKLSYFMLGTFVQFSLYFQFTISARKDCLASGETP